MSQNVKNSDKMLKLAVSIHGTHYMTKTGFKIIYVWEMGLVGLLCFLKKI